MAFQPLQRNPATQPFRNSFGATPLSKGIIVTGIIFLLSELAISLALGEFEQLDELVSMRQNVAKEFERVIADCDWLIPQKTPQDHVHSFWTYAILIVRNNIDWSKMRNFFTNLGGDG